MDTIKQTPRTRLKRARKRGVSDLKVLHQIIDSAAMCHVGYVEDGQPFVTPTIHWREGNRVYWHGSRLSKTLLAGEAGSVCVTVSHFDGLVLARSGFHHSANYRSVMILGEPEIVTDRDLKTEHLRVFVEQLFPDRWETLRPMTRKELNATTILSLPINEASAKVRDGGPIDDEADYDLPVWAGVIPLTTSTGLAQPDARLAGDVPIPDHVRTFTLERTHDD